MSTPIHLQVYVLFFLSTPHTTTRLCQAWVCSCTVLHMHTKTHQLPQPKFVSTSWILLLIQVYLSLPSSKIHLIFNITQALKCTRQQTQVLYATTLSQPMMLRDKQHLLRVKFCKTSRQMREYFGSVPVHFSLYITSEDHYKSQTLSCCYLFNLNKFQSSPHNSGQWWDF
jgi:hypothetical protein